MARKRVCDAAVEVLKETGNPHVMWGDVHLLHEIAERAGIPHQGPRTQRRVLDALSKTSGKLRAGLTELISGRVVRIFRLQEEKR